MNLSAKNQAEYEALGLPFTLPDCETRLIDNDENWVDRRQLLFTEKAANEYHDLVEEVERLRELLRLVWINKDDDCGWDNDFSIEVEEALKGDSK